MKIVSYSIILLLLVSCHTDIKKPKKPDNLLSKKKMVEVIYDMSLISAAKGVNRKVMENKGIQPDVFIYEKHQIDSVQFAESNAYYANDVETYQEIYDSVMVKLKKDKAHFNTLLDIETKRRDSIKQVNKAIKERMLKESDFSTSKDSTEVEIKQPSLLKKSDSSL